MSDSHVNAYTKGPLGRLFLTTALPIIFVMSLNGLLAVADALFLGYYVGPDALAAVTLMFPAYMFVVALSTLVSSGMSSVLARALGAQNVAGANQVFAGAHGLACMVSAGLMVLHLLLGEGAALLAANGSVELASMGHLYLTITVLSTPLMFVLSIHSDALRNEGRVGFMAAMSLFVSVVNILFNYILIAKLGWGVAGSALGTVFAQVLAFAIMCVYRSRGETPLTLSAIRPPGLASRWSEMIALGVPQSLGFVGFALGSAATVTALQMVGGDHYEDTVSAFGIITRIMTFTFLPLLGLSHAMQSIIGNNFGARHWQRSNRSLVITLLVAGLYCLLCQAVMGLYAADIGAYFVEDANVIDAVARILPVMVLALVLVGPLMMVSAYFQAVGEAALAGLLGLVKPFLFAIPLTFMLPRFFGETGIWLSGPVAECLLLALTVAVLRHTAQRTHFRMGLFVRFQEGAS